MKPLVKGLGLAVVSSLILTSCAPAGVKEASVSADLTKQDFQISPDYSPNWWKDQPNGNALVETKWNGEGWLMTANEVSDGVSIIDLKTGKAIAYIPTVGTPHHIHLNKEQTWAFATLRYGSDVVAINMKTLEAKKISFPGFDKKPGPQHLTFSMDGKYAFVSLNAVGAVAQIDAEKAELVEVYRGLGKKPRDMNVTPDGKKVYVSFQAEPYISVIDLATKKATKLERTKTDYGAGTGSGLDMSNDGKYVAIGNTADDEVAIWETATDKLVTKVKGIPKPVNVSFMGNTNYLATGNRNDGSMSIIDLTNMSLVKTVKTGGGTNIPYVGPDGLWYASQNGAGFLSVIDPKHDFRVVRDIWGVQNIHWLYWSSDGKTLFGTNWGDKTVTKIDMLKYKDFRTTYNVGLNPNGMAVKTNVPLEDLEKFRNKGLQAEATLQKARTLVIPNARNEKEKVFLDTCLVCHDIGRILRSNTKGDGWKSTVDRMQGNGAKMDDTQKQMIIDYLKSAQQKSLVVKTELQIEQEKAAKDTKK